VRGQALALAALALAAAACRTPLPALRPLPGDDPRPAALLDAWSRAAQERRALRGRARLAVDGGGGALHLRAAQILVLERPARLRVEVLGFLNQTAAVLVADGERFELFRAEDRSYETGPLRPGLLWEQAHLALAPHEAIELLLGVPALAPGLRPARAQAAADGRLRLDLADEAGRLWRRAEFDAAGRLHALEAFAADGALAWRAEFSAYAPVGGQPVAHSVSLEVAEGDTRAEIRLRDVELNPVLPPDIFRLRAPEPGAGGKGQGG
jgi:hypothetical protein